MGDENSVFTYVGEHIKVVRKAIPLLDEVESYNFADLYRDHPNQSKKSKTWGKFCPGRSEMGVENAMIKLHAYEGCQI
jgi:hypothetical protein